MSTTSQLPNNSIASAIPVEIKIENQYLKQDLPVLYIVNKLDPDSPEQQINLKINLRELENHAIKGFGFTPPDNATTSTPSLGASTAPNKSSREAIPGPTRYNLAIAFRPGVLEDSSEASMTNQLYAAIDAELGNSNTCIVHGPVTRSDNAKVWYVAFQHDINSTSIVNNSINWEPVNAPAFPEKTDFDNLSVGPDGSYYLGDSARRIYQWNPAQNQPTWAEFANWFRVTSIAFLPNGNIYYADGDGNLMNGGTQFYNQDTYEGEGLTQPSATSNAVARASGNRIISIGIYGEFQIYDPATNATETINIPETIKASVNGALTSACELVYGQYVTVFCDSTTNTTKYYYYLFDQLQNTWTPLSSNQQIASIKLDFNNRLVALGTDKKLYQCHFTNSESLFSIPLKGISAKAGAGARVSQIECQLARLTLGYSDLLNYKTTTQFNIVNHQGNTYAPLHFGTMGNNTLMYVPYQKIVNSLKTYFVTEEMTSLTLGAETKITLAFPYNDQSQDIPAFGSSAEVLAYEISKPEKLIPVTSTDLANDLDLTVNATIPYAVVDPIQQKILFQFKVEPQAVGQKITQGIFELTNLQVSGYQGVAFIQVSVQNLPGYWDSIFQIPIVIGNSALTGQLDLGFATNSNSNSGRGFSRIGFLSGLQKEKTPYISIEEFYGLNLYGTKANINPAAPDGQPVKVLNSDLLVPDGRVAIGASDSKSGNTYCIFPSNNDSTLYVKGDSELHGTLTVSGTAYVNGSLTTNNNEKLSLASDTTIGGNTQVFGTLQVGTTDFPTESLLVNPGIVHTPTFCAHGEATMYKNFTANAEATFLGLVTLKGGFTSPNAEIYMEDGWTVFNKNGQTAPTLAHGGSTIGNNRTPGQAQTTLYNNIGPTGLPGNTPAFEFYQITGEGTASELMMITRNGRVGIGTSTPKSPLHVSGVGENASNGKFFDLNNNTILDYENVSIGLSILAESSVVAPRFIANDYTANSDLRIKNNIRAVNIHSDLATLLKINMKDYRHIDHVKQGNRSKRGVIGQELEKTLPEAVIKTTSCIPNIYQVCEQLAINKERKELTCELEKSHDLQVGDKIKLITESDTACVNEVIAVNNERSFTVKNWEEKVDKVFVYGKEVDDFRSVDYTQVSMLGISAIQALHQDMEVLKSDHSELRKEVKTLQEENAELKQKLEVEMQSLRADLEALKAGNS